MKKFKYLSLFLALLASVSFTSCMDDDDDDSNSGLTPAEINQAYSQMAGTHSLSCYLVDQTKSTSSQLAYADSADVTLVVDNDSLMSLRNFPVRMLAEAVTDAKVAEALRQAPNQTVRCYSYYFKVSPVTFLLNPINVVVPLNYDGAEHKVKIGFLANNYYSYGLKNGKNIGMQIYEMAYQVDSNNPTTLSTYGVFHLLSK